MIRHATFDIGTVLSKVLMTSNKKDPKAKANFAGFMVKMFSQRLQMFNLHGTKCVNCDTRGDFFALESHTGENPHFNLYALDDNGAEVLMTKDHIVPKFHGGKDHLVNYQVMCYPCNQQKGCSLES